MVWRISHISAVAGKGPGVTMEIALGQPCRSCPRFGKR
jgi:hypothetical protein